MSLKYYPLTRIKTNLYTRGGEYFTEDGQSYSGRYYVTYDNRAFTGISPALGKSVALIKFFTDTPHQGSISSKKRAASKLNPLESLSAAQAQSQDYFSAELTQLVSYYPLPLETDYTRGYFTRYFAKEVTGPQYVIEISAIDWSKIQNGNVNTNVLLGYEIMDMLWQLTGPVHNMRKSQYQIIGGVYDTNKRVTEAKQKTFRGIVEFIGGDYTKFARITPDSVAISGSM
jgi:hypothetical protein